MPTAKGLFASMTAAIHAAGNTLMEDEVVKSVGLSFGFENTEIATYRALVIAAERAGAPDIAAVCGQILQEEVAMARWLEDHRTAWSVRSSTVTKRLAPRPSVDRKASPRQPLEKSSCSFITRN